MDFLLILPVVMYKCERWIIKKAEQQGIDSFELWCWRRLLRVPWTARSSNQSILKEINHEHSLEGLLWSWSSTTLATWWVKSQLIGKDPNAEKDWRQKKRVTENEIVRQHHWLNEHEIEQTLGDSEGQVSLECYSPQGHKELDMA